MYGTGIAERKPQRHTPVEFFTTDGEGFAIRLEMTDGEASP
jgi:hypothetical protein